MLDVTTTPAMIAVDIGRDPLALSGLETAQFQRWIDDAALLISHRIGDLMPAPNDLDYVIRQAVVAVAQGPTPGVSSESVQIDDGQYTTRFERTPRRVTILPEWWAILGITDGKGRAFTIDMTPSDMTIHAATCSLAFGALHCSCGADIAGYPLFDPS